MGHRGIFDYNRSLRKFWIISSSQNRIMNIRFLHIIIALCVVVVGSGCASTQSKGSAGNNDILEPVNRVSFNFNEVMDRHMMKPIVEPYAKYVPEIYRSGITNFFDNLTYPNVILNSLLQGKFVQGLSDVMRFIVNSTVGFAGLNDIATSMGLEKHDEDFGQTLAVWGVGKGSYLYLPFVGPNTLRNAPDIATSSLLNPLNYITGAVLFPVSVLNIVNTRANLLEATNIRDEAAIEPYSFTREAYLQQRENLIYDGNPPTESYDDIFGDEDYDDSDGDFLSIE